MSKRIRVGAYGWLHEHWQSQFYNQDLPLDWRLTYYANEFNTVLVPACYLTQSADIAQWLDDVNEDFRFYIEWPSQTPVSDVLKQALLSMGNKLAGILLSSQAAQDTEFLALNWPIYSMKSGVTGATIWRSEHPSSSNIALLNVADKDLQQQRQWLEQFNSDSKGNARAILLSDDLLDIQQLRELKTLVELMGL